MARVRCGFSKIESEKNKFKCWAGFIVEKPDIGPVAQLLTGIKDAIENIENAQSNEDAEQFEIAKKEILSFQLQIKDII